MIDETFVKTIAALAVKGEEIKTIEIDGRKYSSNHLTPVELPEPTPLNIDTLTAIKDYLTGNPDGLAMEGILVTVDAPDQVTVYSKLTGAFQQRNRYLLAKWPNINFCFGQFYDVENFIVLLQADFQDKAAADGVLSDRAKILQLVGNLTDGVVRNFQDDGVTQAATIKKGITKVEATSVPNPVLLAPYRTFPEVDQPPSNFVFRMRSGEQAPTCALFEADGGRWKTEAARNIKDWLDKNLPEGVTVLA